MEHSEISALTPSPKIPLREGQFKAIFPVLGFDGSFLGGLQGDGGGDHKAEMAHWPDCTKKIA